MTENPKEELSTSLAKAVEKIFFPTNFMTLGVLLIFVYLRNDETLINSILIFVISLGVYAILMSALKGKISNENKLYLTAGLSVLVLFFLLSFFIKLSRALLFGAYSITPVMFIVYVIRSKWKISGHATGFAATCTALSLIDKAFLPLVVFFPLVAWSRLKLRAHTVPQVAAGTVAGTVLPLLVYFFYKPF
jgi:membrane-associated phospholipid phosphatase